MYRAFKRRGTGLTVTDSVLTGDSVYRLFRRMMKDAGIEGVFGAHSLRSGMIDSALRSGQPIQNVSRNVGHRRLQTTMRYAERGADVYKDHMGRDLLRPINLTVDDIEEQSGRYLSSTLRNPIEHNMEIGSYGAIGQYRLV